eukprot:TRINITY_DN1392_c0_g1_i1.p3 TRINITY_DN1392_c0_g1~~TRINITY_DN1392_c0_g1_i1.p3  ORF type:complete len:102 (-),score=18.19 TRINITY_DN1392_c0_g1_i1:658-963(-)
MLLMISTDERFVAVAFESSFLEVEEVNATEVIAIEIVEVIAIETVTVIAMIREGSGILIPSALTAMDTAIGPEIVQKKETEVNAITAENSDTNHVSALKEE